MRSLAVAVILEMARTIVANPAIKLSAPVVFLLNGGEETLSQAANGFFASSRCGGSLVGVGLAQWFGWQRCRGEKCGRARQPTASSPAAGAAVGQWGRGNGCHAWGRPALTQTLRHNGPHTDQPNTVHLPRPPCMFAARLSAFINLESL